MRVRRGLRVSSRVRAGTEEGVVVGSLLHAGRRWPVALGIAALVLTGLAAPPAQGQEHADHGTGGDASAEGILPPGNWTPDQIKYATDLVHRTEEILPAKFGDLSKLPAM